MWQLKHFRSGLTSLVAAWPATFCHFSTTLSGRRTNLVTVPVAPAVVATLVTMVGGVGALIATGVVGPLVALLLVVFGLPDAGGTHKQSGGAKTPQKSIVTPALIVLTIFFMLLGLSSAGIGLSRDRCPAHR